MKKKYQQGGNIFQDPMQQMWGYYGFDSPMGSLGSQEIATHMGDRYGITNKQLLRPEMFPTLTSAQQLATQSSTYNPMIEFQSQPLLQQLLSGMNRPGMSGGFAGSGALQTGITNLKDVYGRGVTDVLQGALQQKNQAVSNALSTFAGWGQTAQGLRGGV